MPSRGYLAAIRVSYSRRWRRRVQAQLEAEAEEARRRSSRTAKASEHKTDSLKEADHHGP